MVHKPKVRMPVVRCKALLLILTFSLGFVAIVKISASQL